MTTNTSTTHSPTREEFEALLKEKHAEEKRLYEERLSHLEKALSEKDAQILEKEEAHRKELEALRNQLKECQDLIEWFKRQIFGSRSEKMVEKGQYIQLCVEGLEPTDQPSKTDESDEESNEEKKTEKKKRKKNQRNGQDAIQFPPDIPVEKITLDLPEDQKISPITRQFLVKISEEVTQKLACRPGAFYVKEYIRPVYADPSSKELGVFNADLPDSILNKCNADESLLAEIACRKFDDHTPLYRISEIFTRHGAKISRKLLSRWVVVLGLALMPIYGAMYRRVLFSHNIFVDETPVKIQAPGKCDTGYMWLVAGGTEVDPPYRVYDFRTNCAMIIFPIF